MENPLVFMDSKDASCTSFEDEPNTSFNRETDNSENNKITGQDTGATGDIKIKPKSIHRAKAWSDEVENLYRFQQAGYRDEIEYKQVKHVDAVDRWPETGFVKKLQRRDNTYYYYDKERECEDKEVHKVKVYAY